MSTVEEVARLALELPEVTEGSRYGNRSWSVNGRVFAWHRPLTKADLRRFGELAPPQGPIVAVRVADLSEKAAVLAAEHPGVFTIAHFDGYAAVLLQLDVVSEPTLREALVDAWLACAPPKLAEHYLNG